MPFKLKGYITILGELHQQSITSIQGCLQACVFLAMETGLASLWGQKDGKTLNNLVLPPPFQHSRMSILRHWVTKGDNGKRNGT